MKIVHFVTDEKFIDSGIKLFNSIEDVHNTYVRIGFGNFQNIKSKEVLNVDNRWVEDNCISHSNFDVLILHNLYSAPFDIIQKINNQIKIVWFSWGFDLYNNQFPYPRLIKISRSRKEYDLKRIIIQGKTNLKTLLYDLRVNKLKGINNYKKAINRIDFYSGVFPIEYELLSKCKYFVGKRIAFNYGASTSVINKSKIQITPSLDRKHIQVGHYAFYQLNHVTIFKKLKRLHLNNEIKIIAPLSYGPPQDRKRIKNKGYKIFGKRFVPLISFLPFDEYERILQNINIAIFDIDRQCGVGNIVLSFWNGAKVFLPLRSVSYKHFSSIGLKVYSIEEDLTEKEINTVLPDNIVMDNRRILIKHYSFETIQYNLIKSLEIIQEEKK